MLLIIDRISSNFKFRLYKNNTTKLWITQSDRYIVNQEALKLFGLSSKSMSLHVWLQYLTQNRLVIIYSIRCFAFYSAVHVWRNLVIERQCVAEHWSWVVPIYSHVQLLQLFTWKLKMFYSDVPFVQTLTPSLWSPQRCCRPTGLSLQSHWPCCRLQPEQKVLLLRKNLYSDLRNWKGKQSNHRLLQRFLQNILPFQVCWMISL